MNEIINVNEVQTMSSREIVELTGKRHADVCRDVRVMLCSLYGGSERDYIRKADLLYLTNQGVSCIQYDTSNPNGWEYCLDKDNTLCLAVVMVYIVIDFIIKALSNGVCTYAVCY